MNAPPDRIVAIGAILSMVCLVACQRTFSRFDFDGDGIDDNADCEPENPDVYPGAPDPWGVGGDTNCDGVDGVDSDEDGYPDLLVGAHGHDGGTGRAYLLFAGLL